MQCKACFTEQDCGIGCRNNCLSPRTASMIVKVLIGPKRRPEAHLKPLIDKADACELKAFSSDAHFAVHAKQLWLLRIRIGAACTTAPT